MDCVAKQMFFFIFYNSSPTCRGRRILAIYYVKHTHTSHDCQQVSFICFCQSRITLPSVPSSYSCPGDCICNFSHLQIIPALYLWPHSHFFPFADYLPLRTSDCIHNYSHLYIISALYLWPHSQFFPFVDYLCSIFVTAFAIFLICRLSSAPHLPYDCVWGCLQAGLSPQEACFPPPFC